MVYHEMGSVDVPGYISENHLVLNLDSFGMSVAWVGGESVRAKPLADEAHVVPGEQGFPGVLPFAFWRVCIHMWTGFFPRS